MLTRLFGNHAACHQHLSGDAYIVSIENEYIDETLVEWKVRIVIGRAQANLRSIRTRHA